MKTTVNEHQFLEAFRRADRMNGWTRAGLLALFEHIEQLEEDIGEEIELDVVALCCDYSEYASLLEAAEGLGYTAEDGDMDEEEAEEAALAWLQDNTTAITFDGGVIVQAF